MTIDMVMPIILGEKTAKDYSPEALAIAQAELQWVAENPVRAAAKVFEALADDGQRLMPTEYDEDPYVKIYDFRKILKKVSEAAVFFQSLTEELGHR